jgi:hypothetical protein
MKTIVTFAIAAAIASPLTAAAQIAGPKPAIDFAPGVASYAGTLAIGGQSMPVTATRTITESNGSWLVTQSMVLPMGTITDEATFDKGTLILKKRVIHQGPAVIEVNFAGGRATGTIAVNGQSSPISVDLGGDAFANGAGGNDFIGALPLAAGYTASLRTPDLSSQSVKVQNLKVTGSESVTVPAGTFDAYTVELTSAEGNTGEKETLWVDKVTHRVVKTVELLPQMNNAVATMELQK